MRPIDQVRQQYPELKDQPDSVVVDVFSRATNQSPELTSYELGLDPAEYSANEGVLGDVGTALKLGAYQLPGAAAGLVDIVNPATYIDELGIPTASESLDTLYDQTGFGGNMDRIRRFEYSDEAREGFRNQQQAKEQGLGAQALSYITNPGATALKATESLPSLVAGGAAGLGVRAGARALTGAASSRAVAGQTGTAAGLSNAAREVVEQYYPYIGEGAIIAGQQMDNLIEQGVEPSEAASLSFATGTGGAATAGAIGRVGARYGIGDPQAIAAGQRVSGDAPRQGVLKRVAGSAALEGTQEGVQSPLEQLTTNIGTGRPATEDLASAGVEGFALGSTVGGPFGLFPQGQPPALETDEPYDAVAEAQDRVNRGTNENAGEVVNRGLGIGPEQSDAQRKKREADLNAAFNDDSPSGIRVTDPATQTEVDLTVSELLDLRSYGQMPERVTGVPVNREGPAPLEPETQTQTEPDTGQTQTAPTQSRQDTINNAVGLGPQNLMNRSQRRKDAREAFKNVDTELSDTVVIDPITQQEIQLTYAEEAEYNNTGRRPTRVPEVEGLDEFKPTATPESETEVEVEPASVQQGDVEPDPEQASVERPEDPTQNVWPGVFKLRPRSRKNSVDKQIKNLKESVTTLTPESEAERARLAQEVEDWANEGSASSEIRPLVAQVFLSDNQLDGYLEPAAEPEQQTMDFGSEAPAPEVESGPEPEPEPEPSAEQTATNAETLDAPTTNVREELQNGILRAIERSKRGEKIDQKANPEVPEAGQKIRNLLTNWVMARAGALGNTDGLVAGDKGAGDAQLTNELASYMKPRQNKNGTTSKPSGQWVKNSVADIEAALRQDPRLRQVLQATQSEAETTPDIPAAPDTNSDSALFITESETDADTGPAIEDEANPEVSDDPDSAGLLDSTAEEVSEVMGSDTGAGTGADANESGTDSISKSTGSGVPAAKIGKRQIDRYAQLDGSTPEQAEADLKSAPDEFLYAWEQALEIENEMPDDREVQNFVMKTYNSVRENVGQNNSRRLRVSADEAGAEVESGSNDTVDAEAERRAREQVQANTEAGRQLYEKLTGSIDAAPEWADLPESDRDGFIEAAQQADMMNVGDRLRVEQQITRELRQRYEQAGQGSDGGVARGANVNGVSSRETETESSRERSDVRRRAGETGVSSEGVRARDAEGSRESLGSDSAPKIRVKGRGRGTRASRRDGAGAAEVGFVSTSTQRVQDTINRVIGDIPNAPFDSIGVYETVEDARQELGEDFVDAVAWVQTYSDGSQSAEFIAERIPLGQELGVVMHEIGAHMGIDMLDITDRAELSQLINDFAERDDGSLESELAKDSIRDVQEAQARGDEADAETVMSETVAYFINNAVDAGVTPDGLNPKKNPIAEFWQKLVNAFQNAFERVFGGMPEDVTAQDVVDLAFGASRKNIAVAAEAEARRSGRVSTQVEYEDFRSGAQPLGASYARQVRPSRMNAEQRRNVNVLPERARPAVRNIFESIGEAADKGVFGLTFTRDLVERFSEQLPAARNLYNMLFRIEAKRQQDQKEADEIVERFGELNSQEQRAANKYLSDSTIYNAWGYQPEWKEPQTINRIMQQRFNALSPEAQQVIKDVNRYGDAMLAQKQQVMDDWVMKSYDRRIQAAQDAGDTAKAQELQDNRQEALDQNRQLFRSGYGPYAPLKRFGRFVVIGTSPEYEAAKENGDTKLRERLKADPKHFEMSFAESRADANAKRDELKKRFDNADRYEKLSAYERLSDELGSFEALRQALRNDVDEINEGDQQKFEAVLDDLILKSLSEQHSRESQNRRLKVAGFDENMIRSFATQARSDVFWISNLTSIGDVNDTLSELRDQADRPGGGMDRDRKRRVYNNLYNRYVARANPQDTPIQDKLAMFGSVWYLLMSPGYYVQNSLQPVMMTVPWLNQNYKYKDSMDYTTRAYKDIAPMFKGNKFTARFDFEKLPANIRRIAQELEDRNAVHSTISNDLGRFTETGDTEGLKGGFQKFDNAIRELPNKLEQINRLTSGIAAYKLAREKGKLSHEAAVDYAERAVTQTQGDYSELNAPNFLSNAQSPLPTRVIFQFRKFQLIQVGYVARMLNQIFNGATKQEKAAGLRGVMFTMSHAAMVTGLKGLPAIGTAGMLASLVMGDDDEPLSIDRMARQQMQDWGLSPTVTGMIMNGAAEPFFGSTATTKVGWANMLSILPFTDIDFSDRSGYDKVITSALGPTLGGMGRTVFAGMGEIQSGNYYDGLTELLPKGLADPLKAGKYQFNGLEDNMGDRVLQPGDLTPLETLFTALGLPPKTLTDRWYLNSAKYDTEQFFTEQSTSIRRDYEDARQNGESTYEIRQRWRRLQDARKDYGFSTQPMSVLMRSAERADKREENTIAGVKFDSGNRQFIEDTARLIGQ